MLTATIFLFFLTLLGFYVYVKSRKPKGFPDGPPRIPLLGSLPFMVSATGGGNSQLDVNRRMFARYGKVWGAYLGDTPLVKIGDLKLAKELFAMEQFSGRYAHKATAEEDQWLCLGMEGVRASEG